MKGNGSKIKKQFVMYAVPYTRQDKRGKLDVVKSGALALFSSRSLALDYNDGDADEESVIKVRVTIELYKGRTNGNGS